MKLFVTLACLILSVKAYSNALTDTTNLHQFVTIAEEFEEETRFDSAAKYYQLASEGMLSQAFTARGIFLLCQASRNAVEANILDKGTKWAKEAIAIATDTFGVDHLLTAFAIHTYGYSLGVSGKLREQLNQYEKARKIREQFKDIALLALAESYQGLASIHGKLNHQEEELAFAQLALDIYLAEKGEDSFEAAGMYNNLSSHYKRKRDYPKQEMYLRKALTILEKEDPLKKAIIAVVKNNMTVSLLNQERYQEGIGMANEVLELRKEVLGENHPAVAMTYGFLAHAYGRLGDLERQILYYEKALDIQLKGLGEKHPRTAETINNTGSAYYRKEEFVKALEHYEKALTIREDIYGLNHPLTALSYFMVGRTYAKLNQGNKALSYLNITEPVWLSSYGKQHPRVAMLYEAKSDAYRVLDQFQKEEEFLLKALKIQELTQKPPSSTLASVYRKQAFIAQKKGDYLDALAKMQKALHAVSANASPNELADNGHYQADLETISYLKVLNDKLKFLGYQVHNGHEPQKWLSLEEKTLGAIDSAIYQIRQAFVHDQSHESLMEIARSIYQNAISISYRDYQNFERLEDLEKIFGSMEKIKSVFLMESIRAADAFHDLGLPENILSRHKELLLQLNEARKVRTSDRPDKAKSDSVYFSAYSDYEAFIESIRGEYPSFFQYTYQHYPPELQKIQEKARQQETQIVEYFWTDSILYGISITPDSIHLINIPQQHFKKDLEYLLSSLQDIDQLEKQENLQSVIAGFSEHSYRLYQSIVAPLISEHLPTTVIIPDGPLAYLPFEILTTDKDKTSKYLNFSQLPYLFLERNIQYAYSASLWAWEYEPGAKYKRHFTGFAPEYLADSYQAQRDVIQKVGLSGEEWQLGKLQYNQEEVSNIRQYIGGTAYLGTKATEYMFKEQAPQSKILHLALHGFAHPERPPYSMLFFYPSQDSIEDNYLYAYEIYNMKLDAEMVVLSACNTGSGQIMEGEGVMSLARAFRFAGCKSIISSLWQADDQAAGQLLQYFYKYLKGGASKDEALRQAKKEFLSRSDKKHPYYWASFVLVGDPSPISPQRRSIYLWAGIAGFFILLLLIYFLSRKKQPMKDFF